MGEHLLQAFVIQWGRDAVTLFPVRTGPAVVHIAVGSYRGGEIYLGQAMLFSHLGDVFAEHLPRGFIAFLTVSRRGARVGRFVDLLGKDDAFRLRKITPQRGLVGPFMFAGSFPPGKPIENVKPLSDFPLDSPGHSRGVLRIDRTRT